MSQVPGVRREPKNQIQSLNTVLAAREGLNIRSRPLWRETGKVIDVDPSGDICSEITDYMQRHHG